MNIFNLTEFELKKMRRVHFGTTYPENGNAKFRCTLWTFKQQLALKMGARCGISLVLLNVFVL